MNDPVIQPLNVTAATMIIQLLFVCLLAITSKLSVGSPTSPGQSFLRGKFYSALLQKSPLLLVLVLSFIVLMLSADFYAMWSPVLGGAGIPKISAAASTTTVFVIDILAVSYLVAVTGGSNKSPFLTALFTIPALAIFLRASPSVFFGLAALVAAAYCFLFIVRDAPFQPGSESQPGKSAAAFVNITCLVLSMFTGYLTRPVSIDQLQAGATEVTQQAATCSPSQKQ